MNLDLNLTPYTKINLQCITDLNVRQNYKTFRKIIEENLQHL